ncbi:Bacterial extracellular solute-binding protein, family 3 (fragment) [Pseudodesulfovibrio profundus]|uniref:Bacterial extracellular solute-binding protein, family 3 n=1 Tax=Pseudodesulfovibrio profundus TaxID=57320 RepID=A0A2C8FBE6_9BACT
MGPIFEEGDYFFKKKGTELDVRSLRDARIVKRIAVRKDGYTHQALQEAGFDNLDISPSYDSSYKKLAEGRVDLVLLGERTYYYMVRKAGLDHTLFEKTECKFAESGAWLAFSKDIPDETILKWQQALDTLKENGVFDQIMERNFSH